MKATGIASRRLKTQSRKQKHDTQLAGQGEKTRSHQQ